MRSKAAPLFAALILAFAYLSLFFSRRTPVMIQNVLFLVALVLELVMIVAGWWYCFQDRKANDIPIWRRRIGWAAVTANTTALAIPVGSLVYMIFYPAIGLRMNLPMIDADKMMLACLACSLGGLIAGILAPERTRFATSVGSLIMAMLVLAIPMGVL